MDKTLLTDEELCSLIRSGNQNALNELSDRYKCFILKVAREHFLSDGDYNDLFQEGMLGLVNAVYHFNGDSNFKNYCLKSIKNSIYSAIRKSNSRKNKPLSNYISLSGNINDDENSIDKSEIVVLHEEPENELIKQESEKELNHIIKQSLSTLEYSILKMYLIGNSYTDISAKVGKPVKSVDNALQRIRKKLREKIKVEN